MASDLTAPQERRRTSPRQQVADSDWVEVLERMLGDHDGDVVCNVVQVLGELLEEEGGFQVRAPACSSTERTPSVQDAGLPHLAQSHAYLRAPTQVLNF